MPFTSQTDPHAHPGCPPRLMRDRLYLKSEEPAQPCRFSKIRLLNTHLQNPDGTMIDTNRLASTLADDPLQ